MSQVTEILSRIESVDPTVVDEQLPLVDEELSKVVAGRLSRERREQTPRATVLVHEDCLRLVDQGGISTSEQP